MIDLDRPRLKELHESIVRVIPCWPAEARIDLEKMALPSLLICYMNWRDRFIPTRSRQVRTWGGLLRHGVGKDHIPAVLRIEQLIALGADLTPFLSDKIKKFGYTRPTAKKNGKRRGIEWRDKDYALNAYDIHHLHLSEHRRTKELLYAEFGRTNASLLMVGDHNSFDDGTLLQAITEARANAGDTIHGVKAEGSLTPKEQSALARRGFTTIVTVGDQVVLGAMLSSAGTSVTHSRYASRIMIVIEAHELLIDDGETCRQWAQNAGRPYPDNPRFLWSLQDCDFGVFEETTSTFYSLLRWLR